MLLYELKISAHVPGESIFFGSICPFALLCKLQMCVFPTGKSLHQLCTSSNVIFFSIRNRYTQTQSKRLFASCMPHKHSITDWSEFVQCEWFYVQKALKRLFALKCIHKRNDDARRKWWELCQSQKHTFSQRYGHVHRTHSRARKLP